MTTQTGSISTPGANFEQWYKYLSSMPSGFLYISFTSDPPPRPGQFWPHGHNLNNLGRGLLGYASHQVSKLYLSVSEKNCFRVFSIFSKSDLVFGHNDLIWTTLRKNTSRMLPAKFHLILQISFRDVVRS